MNKLPLIVSVSIISLLFSATSVLAASPAVERQAAASDTPVVVRGQAQSKQAAPPGQLRACQAKEAAIKYRSLKLVQFANGMLNQFSTISSRVQTFYLSKVVPQGKVVSNYAALLSDIQTKQASAQAALQKARDDAASFSCTAGKPKEQLATFHSDMQKVKETLKEYRFSIRNLIVAVHSVGSAQNNYEASSAAGRPSVSPKANAVGKPSVKPSPRSGGQEGD